MGMKAKNVMTTKVVTAKPDDSLDEVFAMLLRYHVSGVPVVDDEGYLLGVITEYDLLNLLYDTSFESGIVSDCLTENVITVHEDESLCDIAELFMSKAIRRIPVLRDEKVIGIISRRDLIRYIREVRIRVSQQLEMRANSSEFAEMRSAS